MALRKKISGQKGFTLIELLVVVAILGILAGIAVPRIIGAIDSARERRDQADLVTISDALNRFYLDYGCFPIALDDLQQLNYLDLNFDFTNAWGKRYFYAVKIVGDYSGVAVWPTDPIDPEDFKDYLLADPKQTPQVDIATAIGAAGRALDYSCEGLPIDQCYYWGGSDTHMPAGALRVNITNLSLTVSEMNGTPTAINPSPDPNTTDYGSDPGNIAVWVASRGK